MSTSAARLAWPLAVSLSLHLGIGALLSAKPADYLSRSLKVSRLTVVLPARSLPEPKPDRPREQPPAPAAASVPRDPAGTMTQKARFLVEPDLAALEEIPVPFPGSLNIRLHVSAQGNVDRVSLLKGDPVPKELLAGLMARMEHARLAPALAGSDPVASTLDLVIRFEPGPTPLAHDN